MIAILVVILFILLAFLIKVFPVVYTYLTLKIKLRVIPGPNSVAMLVIYILLLMLRKDEIFMNFWRKLSTKYKNGIYVIWIGTLARVSVCKPHQVEVILKNPALIRKSSSYGYLTDWLGNGLVTSTDDVWHRRRRLLTPAFHFGILNQFSEVIFDKVSILNDSIRSLYDEDPNRPINIFPMAIKFTLDTACKTIMGLDLDLQGKGKNEYVEALHCFSESINKRVFCFWLWSDFIFNLSQIGQTYWHSIKTMHDFTRKVINEKIKMRKEYAVSNPKKKTTEDSSYSRLTPFLDLLIDLSEADENPLTLEEIREEVDTIMFASHDTTGISISYVLFCLGNFPEVQEKVYKEIEQVVHNACDTPTKQQLAQLKYLERVIKEALRLFPAAPSVMRKLSHDIEIDGYHIPKDVDVHIMIMQMHWDPEVWPDPTKFDPDRFLPENCVGRHPYAYIPFSAGPRNCIGQKFAMLLLKLSVVKILREWMVYSDKPIADLKHATQFVLTPPNQTLNLRFQRRRQH